MRWYTHEGHTRVKVQNADNDSACSLTVYKTQCVFSFDDEFSQEGLYVSLKTFKVSAVPLSAMTHHHPLPKSVDQCITLYGSVLTSASPQ